MPLEPGELSGAVLALSPVAGAVVGSFLNVVAARVPHGRSIVGPASACPACGHRIRWHDNIPLLSFVLLRGRCRDCRGPIPRRYPAVEGVTSLLFLLAAAKFVALADPEDELTARLVPLSISLLLISVSVVVSAIDLTTGLILDAITVPLLMLGVALSLAGVTVPFSQAVLGALAGAGIFAAMNMVWKEGMGWGDVKYVAGLGAFLGLPLTLFLVLLAALAGSAVGIYLVATGRRGRRDKMPFGPYLAGASVLTIFIGQSVVDVYLGLLSGGP